MSNNEELQIRITKELKCIVCVCKQQVNHQIIYIYIYIYYTDILIIEGYTFLIIQF